MKVVLSDAESKERALEELRTIAEKVEQKAHVPPDIPDIVALRRIVENKISELEVAKVQECRIVGQKLGQQLDPAKHFGSLRIRPSPRTNI